VFARIQQCYIKQYRALHDWNEGEFMVAFYNQRGTAEQWIKEGKGAIKWTRLSCRSFAANAVRPQLHALAYNLGNFMQTLAMPKASPPDAASPSS
jgi:hypothetical protein